MKPKRGWPRQMQEYALAHVLDLAPAMQDARRQLGFFRQVDGRTVVGLTVNR